ncbi:MAG: DUF2764 family protein [Syntrophales bacterium]|jgi:hypothetical protein|nr:DUF2764 family protein [Syntrophales bacterium]
MGGYYFLRCALPHLPNVLGEVMPAAFGEISGMIRRNVDPEDEHLFCLVLQAIDVVNWEWLDQGRPVFIEGGTTKREDLKGSPQTLPLFIRAFHEERERVGRRGYLYDRLWERYLGELFAAAQEAGNSFLLMYLPWEIGLRNSLTALKCKERGLNIEEHIVLPQIQSRDPASVLSHAATLRDPLQIEHYLDEERLKAVFRAEGADPFSFDAVLAYAVRAMIYSRWDRMRLPFGFRAFLYGGGST